ncbi:MAG TPA: LysE family transporter [Lysobacter sp.]|nr:LysE family transporter [Lysobacter sp.]
MLETSLVETAPLAFAAYFVATASPGPSNLTIMAAAMHDGRRAALALAAGVVTGSLFWGLLAACGLSAVLAAYSGALVAMKIAGGCYLLWLAWRSLRSAMTPTATTTPSAAAGSTTLRHCFMRGFALHITNPKAIFAWLSIVSLALPAGASAPHALAIVAGCIVIGVFVFGGYALLFSAPLARRVYLRIRRWLDAALAAVFATAGLKMLLSRS